MADVPGAVIGAEVRVSGPGRVEVDVEADVGPSTGRQPAPPGLCPLCWEPDLVEQDGHWFAQHVGSLDECTHSCHDDGFLASSS